MASLGLAVYAACVDFLLRVAGWLQITYRDANAALFFLLWPAVTGILLVLVCGQGLWLARRERAQAKSRVGAQQKTPATPV
jgi:hypothetical protein